MKPSRTIAQYIGAGIQKIRLAPRPATRWPPAARHLCRLFLKCQSRHTVRERWSIPDNPRYRNLFEDLDHRIRQYEQQMGVRVNRNLYMKAHFRFFGAATYPNHLMAACSWALYKTHERLERVQEQHEGDEDVAQGKLLRFLALTRSESELRVLTALKDSGLFTPEFVHSRGLSCQSRSTRSIAPGSENSSPSSSSMERD